MAICSNKSSGVIVTKNEKFLLLERKSIPYGFAAPAGHVENKESFEEAANRELKEETGSEGGELIFLGEAKRENNPCKRGGRWHYWKVYAVTTEKDPIQNDESRQLGWFTRADLLELAKKTEAYRRGEIPEDTWRESPGLEPVWYEWFKELKII